MELSLFEKSKLDSLEKTIQAGMQTVFDVGSALLEVRDSKLYRSNHSTFEEYCRVRWGMSRPRAYQLIEAATVKGNLSTMVDIPERQTRPLTRLEPEQQKEAWEGAVRQGKFKQNQSWRC